MIESLQEHLRRPGPAQARAVHARAARRVPRRQPHPDAGREHRRRWRCSPSRPSNTMFGLYDMFSGGNLSQVTIFALGIMPYISASIILQLLTVVWPYLERLSKEGELGRRKITQYTRYGTILLSVVQSLGIAIFLERQTQHRRRPAAGVQPGLGLPPDDGADADDRHDLHHVARRADHRARHRQRHVAHHLRRHRRRAARARSSTTFDQMRTGQMGLIRIAAPAAS